ncbi:MAG: PEP-CTERM sorting domain-containing protein [Puniceicoccaceae bacterium]|nr:MAG: PEP-CTERM sorting domain-containing protein [Puniceicoccaceae bacterium]
MKRILLPLLAGAALALPFASAQTILTEWKFTDASAYPANTSTPAASSGTGIASIVGINSPTNADFTNTSGSRAWRIRGTGDVGGNGWDEKAPSGSQGARFDTSTAGFTDVNVTLSWWVTNNAIKHAQFQFTTDGSTWIDFGDVQTAGNAGDFANGAEIWTVAEFDLSGIAAVNDNPDFGFRFVAVHSPVAFTTNDSVENAASTAYMVARFDPDGDTRPFDGSSGNWRFGDVTVTAIPEPSAYALLFGLTAVAAAVFFRRRRS